MLQLSDSDKASLPASDHSAFERKQVTQRNEKGQLMQGSVCNPNGPIGKQIFSKAALKAIFDDFLIEYSLLEIETLANDEIARGKLSTAKGLVLARIMDALKSGGGQDFDRIMDRAHGKVTGDAQQVNVQVNVQTELSESDKEILVLYKQKIIEDHERGKKE